MEGIVLSTTNSSGGQTGVGEEKSPLDHFLRDPFEFILGDVPLPSPPSPSSPPSSSNPEDPEDVVQVDDDAGHTPVLSRVASSPIALTPEDEVTNPQNEENHECETSKEESSSLVWKSKEVLNSLKQSSICRFWPLLICLVLGLVCLIAVSSGIVNYTREASFVKQEGNNAQETTDAGSTIGDTKDENEQTSADVGSTIDETKDNNEQGSTVVESTIDDTGKENEQGPADNIFETDASVINVNSTTAFISEIHYDNIDGDENQFVEVAFSGTLDVSFYKVELYRGATGAVYDTLPLLEFEIGTSVDGLTFASRHVDTMYNAMNGLALIDNNGQVIEFLSYEGSFVASDGAAVDETSSDIGIFQTGQDPKGWTLQKTGTGCLSEDFEWGTDAVGTEGGINVDMEITC